MHEDTQLQVSITILMQTYTEQLFEFCIQNSAILERDLNLTVLVTNDMPYLRKLLQNLVWDGVCRLKQDQKSRKIDLMLKK